MLSGYKLSSLFITCRSMHRASLAMFRNQAMAEGYIADHMGIELKWIILTTANIPRVLNKFLNDCCTHSQG